MPFRVKVARTNRALACFERGIAVLVSFTVARVLGARQKPRAGAIKVSF